MARTSKKVSEEVKPAMNAAAPVTAQPTMQAQSQQMPSEAAKSVQNNANKRKCC